MPPHVAALLREKIKPAGLFVLGSCHSGNNPLLVQRMADGVLQLGHLLHPDAVPDPGLAAIELQPVTTPR